MGENLPHFRPDAWHFALRAGTPLGKDHMLSRGNAEWDVVFAIRAIQEGFWKIKFAIGTHAYSF